MGVSSSSATDTHTHAGGMIERKGTWRGRVEKEESGIEGIHWDASNVA